MKVVIAADEWYPVYSIDREVDEYKRQRAVEVDAEFLERYDKCMAEFQAIQDILKEKER